jgi:hypothetical protein
MKNLQKIYIKYVEIFEQEQEKLAREKQRLLS